MLAQKFDADMLLEGVRLCGKNDDLPDANTSALLRGMSQGASGVDLEWKPRSLWIRTR